MKKEFKDFDTTMRKILSVPRAELQRREEKWKKEKREVKSSGNSKKQ